MKNIIILFLIFSAQIFAKEASKQWFVIENSSEVKPQILRILKKKNIDLKKLSNFDSDFFRRTYTLHGTEAELNELKKHLKVKKVEKSSYAETQSLLAEDSKNFTSDPLSHLQWSLFNQKQLVIREVDDIQGQRIKGKDGADIAYKMAAEGILAQMQEDVIVSVIDSGLDFSHPDLQGRYFINQAECDEGGEPRFQPEDDRDENGLKGDCRGWDFTREVGGHRFEDSSGHGTHVSGIIAAKADNGLGIAGILPKVKILPLKVIADRGEEQGALTHHVAQAILYSIKMKAKVINMSLGGPCL